MCRIRPEIGTDTRELLVLKGAARYALWHCWQYHCDGSRPGVGKRRPFTYGGGLTHGPGHGGEGVTQGSGGALNPL